MNPPPNPNADAARAAIMMYYECDSEYQYHLTWPAAQRGICVIAGQWRRNESGEIEAWYSAAQLRESLAAMQAAKK